MKKKLIGIVIVLLLVISFSVVGYAADYEINYSFIQHRAYENGKSINRLVIAMKYSESNNVTDENVIENVLLYDEVGNQVELDNVSIYLYDAIYPFFNCNNIEWQNGHLDQSTWYAKDIIGDLIPGDYTIVVEDINGVIHDDNYYFRGEVDLPIVSSKTFKYKFDDDGNLYWNWEVPKGMFYLDPDIFFDTFDQGARPLVRAMIHGYQNDELSNIMWIKLPYLMSGVFVPASWGFLYNEYDRVEIGIQVQLQDFSTRTYSNMKKIKIKIK